MDLLILIGPRYYQEKIMSFEYSLSGDEAPYKNSGQKKIDNR